MAAVKCKECGGKDLAWGYTQINTSDVADGRLRAHDVKPLFYLGCNVCSATIKTLRGDQVAALMTAQLSGKAKP